MLVYEQICCGPFYLHNLLYTDSPIVTQTLGGDWRERRLKIVNFAEWSLKHFFNGRPFCGLNLLQCWRWVLGACSQSVRVCSSRVKRTVEIGWLMVTLDRRGTAAVPRLKHAIRHVFSSGQHWRADTGQPKGYVKSIRDTSLWLPSKLYVINLTL